DVGALAYPGRVTSGLWVPESEIERFVGSAALGRARGYANLDTLRDVHFEPGSRTLSARVQGTGSRAYRTEVTFGQRAAEGWRRQLEQAVTGLRSGGPSPDGETYGLQLSMVPDENIRDGWEGGLRPGLGNRLRGRIVVPGKGSRWKAAGVEWDRLRYGWTADM